MHVGVAVSCVKQPPTPAHCATPQAYKESTAECWYYRNDSGCSATKDKPWGPAEVAGVSGCSAPAGPGSDQTVCEAVPLDPEVQRLCACTGSGGGGARARSSRGAAEEGPPPPPPPRGQAGEGDNQPPAAPPPMEPVVGVLGAAKQWLARVRKAVSSSSARASTPALGGWVAATIISAGLAMDGGGGGGALLRGAAAVLAVVSLAASPAAAHNWMMTPSRSYKKAATTMPCILRKATDTHQQVGPGQSFVMCVPIGKTGKPTRAVTRRDFS